MVSARESLFADVRRRIREAKTPLRMVVMAHEAEAILDDVVRLRVALEELLDVTERSRAGDSKLDPEAWYAARDYARHVLKEQS